MKLSLRLVAIIVASLLFVGCTNANQDQKPQDNQSINNDSAIGTPFTADMQIEVSNTSIAPAKIEVRAGQEIFVEVISTEGTHSLIVNPLNYQTDEFNEDEGVGILEFTVPLTAEPGETFEYYSTANEDVRGEIVVVE